MDRLTTYDPDRRPFVISANQATYNAIYDRLAAYEDTGLEPEEAQKYLDYEFDPESTARIVQTIIRYPLCLKNVADLVETIHPLLHMMDGYDAVKRIENWMQADFEGRMFVLPCKVGDTVYTYGPDQPVVDKWDVVHTGVVVSNNGIGRLLDFQGLGKTWFLSREDAQAALKGCNT